MTMKKLGLAMIAASVVSTVSASDKILFGVQGGYASGGDTLATLNYSNGNSDSIQAGTGILIGAFMTIPVNDDLHAKVALSYLNDDAPASNATLSFTRYPLDVLLVKDFETFSIGAGTTYHFGVDYEATFNGSSVVSEHEIDDAFGLLLEANYHIKIKGSRDLDIGLRYTNIEYNFDFTSGSDVEVDGSSIAVTLGSAF